MRADDRAIADLASSVADGAAIDWRAAEELLRTPQERRLVRHLKLVESIAELHRSIPFDDQAAIAVAPPQADAHTWGRLVLLDRIGEGMSAEVYRARDTALHREVALKLLRDEGSARQTDAPRRILEEARRLARIRHNHVVHVYGAEQHDGRVGLWMELIAGESLEQIVKGRGRLGAKEATMVGLDLCSALAAVHAAGLLHRDVKAQNVMREADGRIVLMDFGTGEELRQDAGSNRMIGTPLYLAPEVFRGKPATTQSDVYSLGVLLFYAVTAEFPVMASSMIELGRAHSQGARRRLRDIRPDLPAPFVNVVERAVERDPASRFKTAGEMEAALQRSLDLAPHPTPVSAPVPAAISSSPAAPLWSHRLAFLGMAAALLLVIAGLIVWTRQPAVPSGVSIGSLAVLPIVDRSPAAVADVADAMTEQLIATIGRIDSLRTTSWTSARVFRGSTLQPAAIANQLGVNAVLASSMTASGTATTGAGRVRLETELIAAGNGSRLWTGTFESARGDIAGLHARVATALADAVNVSSSGRAALREMRPRQTSPAAEEAYLQGRLHLANYGVDAAQRALAAFQRAVEIDPHHSAAHAGAALAYVRLGHGAVMSHADARVSALAEIRRAFEDGEDSAEAHAAQAEVSFLYDADWDGAERAYQRALEINPSFVYPRVIYAQLLAARHRFDEARKMSEETLALDPQSHHALTIHGMILYYSRDFAAAEEIARRALAREPGNAAGYVLAARVAGATGKNAEALAMINRALALVQTPPPILRVMAAGLEAAAGSRVRAETAAAELERITRTQPHRIRPREIAYLRLGLGQEESALEAFEAALAERDPQLVWLTVDPRVDALRESARFKAILTRLKLP